MENEHIGSAEYSDYLVFFNWRQNTNRIIFHSRNTVEINCFGNDIMRLRFITIDKWKNECYFFFLQMGHSTETNSISQMNKITSISQSRLKRIETLGNRLLIVHFQRIQDLRNTFLCIKLIHQYGFIIPITSLITVVFFKIMSFKINRFYSLLVIKTNSLPIVTIRTGLVEMNSFVSSSISMTFFSFTIISNWMFDLSFSILHWCFSCRIYFVLSLFSIN